MDEQVEWSHEARTVLRQVFLYLWDEYGEDYARRYLSKVFKIVEGIALHPTKGRPASTSRSRRRWKIDDHHYVVYEVKRGGIKILSMVSYKRGE